MRPFVSNRLSLVGVLFLGACASSKSPLTYEEYLERMAAATCEQQARCEVSSSAKERLVTTREACTERFFADLGLLRELVANESARFDGRAAEECLASYADLCAGGWVNACRRVLEGTVADGDACQFGIQCVSGSCSSNGTQCGTCITAVPEGGSCTPGMAPCAGATVCIDGTCALLEVPLVNLQVGEGEECGVEDAASENRHCAPGLFCVEGACQPRLDDGERCNAGGDSCQPESTCIDVGDGGFRCVHAEMTSEPGHVCGDDEEGRFVFCDPSTDLSCQDELCASAIGNGDADESCLLDADCHSGICIRNFAAAPGTCSAGDLADEEYCWQGRECASRNCFLHQCRPSDLCAD